MRITLDLNKIIRKANKNSNKNLLWIYFCILIFSLMKLLIYLTGKVFFDEGVYVGIARYFASGGTKGFFEYIRPLLLPFILAPLQYLPVNPLISGRILCFLLTIGCIVLIYHISRIHFGVHSARWSSLLFAASSLVIFFGGTILTDVLVFPLVLLSASLALREKWFFAGSLLGISFLLKFPVLILCLPITLLIVFKYRYKFLIPGLCFAAGLILFIIPYFLFNFFHYSGPIFERIFSPLMDASLILQNDTWIYQKASLWKYLLFLSIIELPILISLIFSLRKIHQREKRTTLFFIICAFSFMLYFSFFVSRLDFRYMLSVIPFLSAIGGIGLSRVIKKNWKAITLILIPPSIFVFIFLLNGTAKTTVDIPSAKELVFTNAAQALLNIEGKAVLYPGPNLGHLYLQWYLNSSAEWLIIDLEGYPCHKKDNHCKENLRLQISRLLTANKIFSCGKLYGGDTIILAKHPKNTIKLEDCIHKIRGGPYINISVKPYVRLHAAVITQEGKLQNIEGLRNVINELTEQRISSVLVIVASNTSLDETGKKFISELPENIELGVLPNQGINVSIFIKWFKNQTNKKITVIASPSDDWIRQSQEFPEDIEYCVRGAWDQTIMKIPCKRINLYTIQDWKSLSFYNATYLSAFYDALSNVDYQVGIDIPVAALNQENIGTITKFIEVIGNNNIQH